jgi:hypothetical protein
MQTKIIFSFLFFFAAAFSMEHQKLEPIKEKEREALQYKIWEESCETFVCCLGTVFNLTVLYFWGNSDLVKDS